MGNLARQEYQGHRQVTLTIYFLISHQTSRFSSTNAISDYVKCTPPHEQNIPQRDELHAAPETSVTGITRAPPIPPLSLYTLYPLSLRFLFKCAIIIISLSLYPIITSLFYSIQVRGNDVCIKRLVVGEDLVTYNRGFGRSCYCEVGSFR